jgi:hypothetical protein
MDQINEDKIILAYFDIQAYSSFVGSNSKADCVNKTKDLLDVVKRDLQSRNLENKVRHWILSDSIIIIPDIESCKLDISAIDFLVTMSSCLLYRGVSKGLLLRGAVGAGYFYKDDDIVVSSALVDAAAYEKEQNWYGAVITPTALKLINEIYPGFENEYKTLHNFDRFLAKGNIPWKDSKQHSPHYRHKILQKSCALRRLAGRTHSKAIHGKELLKPQQSFYIKPARRLANWRKYLPTYIEINCKVQNSDFLYGDGSVSSGKSC